MAGIEEERVPRRLEAGVERDRQLDRPEIGADMASRLGNVLEQEAPNLRCQIFQFG